MFYLTGSKNHTRHDKFCTQIYDEMGTSYSKQDKLLLKKVGNQIKGLRLRAGLSQEKLAFTSGLDRTYIGSVERGERNISVLNLCKIAKALDVPLSDLLNF